MSILSISKIIMDFPGSPVVKNPPCKAEDNGLIPCQGTKIPQAIEQSSCMPQLGSPQATTTEHTHSN